KSIFDVFSKVLNFTYRVISPPDGAFGGPRPDGTVSGVMGVTHRHESHFSMGGNHLTLSRDTVVDFTTPTFVEGLLLVQQAPKEQSKTTTVAAPFTYTVWILIIISIILIGPILSLLNW
ncbi:unnamed protein product, partial [Meganyctiphanes norvegica]